MIETTRARRWYAFLLRRTGVLTLVAGIGLLVASPFALRLGLAHPEAYLFIPHYLGEGTALEKIFDPSHADSGYYQARELSYAVDLIDCEFIAACVDLGHPHLLSLSHFVLMGATAFLMWFIARYQLRLSGPVSGLLVLMFATTPAVFLGGGYFRSAKAGAAFCCTALIALVLAQVSNRDGSVVARGVRWTLLLVTSFALGAFDRQGFAISLIAAAWVGAWAILARRRIGMAIAGTIATSAALVSLYNHVIGPALIARINHYQPDAAFQHLPWADLLQSPGSALSIGFYAPVLFLDDLRFLVGDMPLLGAAMLVLAAILILACRRSTGTGTRASLTVAWLAFVPFALIVMNALMILRLKAVLNLDYRRVYYGLPTTTVLWGLGALALAEILRRRPRWHRPVIAIAALVVTCNLGALNQHRAIIRRGLYLQHHDASAAIIAALRHLDEVPATKAHAPYWPAIGDTPPIDDGLVRFFRHRQLERAATTSGSP